MTPNYSILLCNQPYAEYRDKIEKWLSQGIKVLWFSEKESEIEALKQKYEAYAGLFLFLAYKVSFAEQRVVVDGEEKDGFVAGVLADACPLFNAAQYLVEHCSAREHIIVQASAGTGKTTVMVDRILYLLYTQPELRMSEIYMITFTNDAANEMKQRLQKTLMGRYRLTRSLRYLRWLEELPQIHISTIHSFAYDMLKQYGIGAGFTAGLSIKSLEYERGELLREVLDEQLDSTMGIREQIGLPYYRAKSVAEEFWAAFSKLGVSSGEVKKMDWGQPSDISSEGFQNVMERMTGRLDDRYFDRKSKEEAIGVEDIMRDLQDILEEGILPSPDISMKYLFIDEFQDSDLAQIHVACQMVQLLDARLFVVGDVKQSIYRFRGATDQAFELLQKKMKENGIPPAKKFTLKNNYRTSAEVMETMDECFAVWDEMGLLQYESSVIPFNHAKGRMRLIRGEDKERLNRQIVCAVSEELESLMERIAREKIQEVLQLRQLVKNNVPELLHLLLEYQKYQKSETGIGGSVLYQKESGVLYRRISDLLENLGITMEESIYQIRRKQERILHAQIDTISETMHSDEILQQPFTRQELTERADVESSIASFEAILDGTLPQVMRKSVNRVIYDLKSFDRLTDILPDEKKKLRRFLRIYVPEVVEMLVSYQQYRRGGFDQKSMDELEMKIQKAMDSLDAALKEKQRMIGNMETMRTAAQAETLKGLLDTEG